jgi:hypothetical protein
MTDTQSLPERPEPAEFTIDIDTQVEVAWEDAEGPKRVTVGMDFQELAAALLTMPNDWGVISLLDQHLTDDGMAATRRMAWCLGDGSAKRIHASKIRAAEHPAELQRFVDRGNVLNRTDRPEAVS